MWHDSGFLHSVSVSAIHPHQRCGYSDSPFSRGYTFSILQGPETDFREWKRCVDTQKTENHIKRTLFLIEKCFEDARQDEKHVPDLLEAVMRPTDPVKDELRQKLFKIDHQFESEIKKIRFHTFRMSRKSPDSANEAFEAVILTHPHSLSTHPHPLFAIFGRASGQIFKKMWF